MPRRRSSARSSSLYREFGNQVRILRDARGMRQSDLATIMGLNRTSITNIELGRQHVTLDGLYAFATALHVPPQKLLPPQNPFGLSKRPGNILRQ